MLTKAEIEALSPKFRAIYAKQRQIDALEELLTALALRFVPGQPGAADIEDAMGDLEIRLGALRAEGEQIIKSNGVVQAITADEVEALQAAIRDLSGLIAASAAVGDLLDAANDIAGRFA